MELHATARKIGNSWGLLIPREIAALLAITPNTRLHVELKVLPELKELKGTLKTSKSIGQLRKEIDEGWD